MKAWLWMAGLMVGVAAMHGTEEAFSRAVPRADFNAAGLSKLTPDELARLDALVRDYQSGAFVAAQRAPEAAKAAAAHAEEVAKASKPRNVDAKPGAGLIERAKVLLSPGTKIEYTTLESRLATEFHGWQRNTVFTLENGQRWRVVGDSTYVTPSVPAPRVRIAPGVLGSFFMEIEGVRQRVKVESLDAK